MRSTSKWMLAAPLAAGLVVAACGGDDEATAEPVATEAPTAAAVEPEQQGTEDANDDTTANDAGNDVDATATLGDEVISIERTLCYFEEQERAGLGGVWTHTSQAIGTNESGEPVTIGLDRARDEPRRHEQHNLGDEGSQEEQQDEAPLAEQDEEPGEQAVYAESGKGHGQGGRHGKGLVQE